MRNSPRTADYFPNMGPIETLVIGIFTMLFMLIGIFWVGSDERPSRYSARRRIDR
jgi:hypothetical protein